MSDPKLSRRSAVQAGLLALAQLTILGRAPRVRGATAESPRKRGKSPNVVFILIDSLRADRLGAYGDGRNLTPMMDTLAAEGVTFERIIAPCSWTLPSVASYMTGLYPTAHNVNMARNLPGATKKIPNVIYKVDPELPTLAEAFKAHGYDTVAFSANPFVKARNGFGQGFDAFYSRFARNTTPGSVVNQAAVRWLQQRKSDKPFFMYLHYMDVHGPYVTAGMEHVEKLVREVAAMEEHTPLPELQGNLKRAVPRYKNYAHHRKLMNTVEYWDAIYTAAVPQMDHFLSQLRQQLGKLGVWKDAHIVLTADHGEALYENGIWSHGQSAHQNQLHVPLILRQPGQLPAKKRVKQTASLIDVYPTLLEHVGAPAVEGIQARSLVPAITNSGFKERPLLSEAVKLEPGQKALVKGRWKLLGDIYEKKWQLFDNREDPWDQRDIAAQHPQRVSAMKKELRSLLVQNKRISAARKEEEVEISPEDEARLRALGYLQGTPDDSASREATTPDDE